jgi:hypothetical protein
MLSQTILESQRTHSVTNKPLAGYANANKNSPYAISSRNPLPSALLSFLPPSSPVLRRSGSGTIFIVSASGQQCALRALFPALRVLLIHRQSRFGLAPNFGYCLVSSLPCLSVLSFLWGATVAGVGVSPFPHSHTSFSGTSAQSSPEAPGEETKNGPVAHSIFGTLLCYRCCFCALRLSGSHQENETGSVSR